MKNEKVLTIEPDCKISQLQKDFNLYFPYLRLEFFKHMHAVHGANSRKDLLGTDLKLKLKKKQAHPFQITEDMLVSTLEQMFAEYYELSVQVFRKSGRSWLETSLTDDWTLKRQNDEGFELSNIA
jgi:hypothetical protein